MTKKRKNTRKWSKAGNVAKKVVPVIIAGIPLAFKVVRKSIFKI